eukprot:TRINITY_DN817_c0_g1_i2.p2 TRINITY_DN817_c0_g1~~TRINITY_DN817_c0_g1_i2.p2  ORF type:complete len:132 (+),score=25.05 TRINITY_DN817_c0_g1_i2:431-826(+)
MIDDTNSGSLSAQQLQKLGARVGLKWNPIEAQEILTACDVDGNGRVDKADFVKVMKAAWDQPQEQWEDVKIGRSNEEQAKLAARQAGGGIVGQLTGACRDGPHTSRVRRNPRGCRWVSCSSRVKCLSLIHI